MAQWLIIYIMNTKNTKERIEEIEKMMKEPNFWNDSVNAQKLIKELNILKAPKVDKYSCLPAVLTIVAGTGGDDAEDFARILFEMYSKFCNKIGYSFSVIDQNVNEMGGFKSISIELNEKGAYGKLRCESGVHRLVRISPFNSKKQRHTSFALVEVIPKLPKLLDIDVPEGDLKYDYTLSSGPGGQNVNKRETSVRITHIPTSISVRSESERSQPRNKENALLILKGKLFNLMKKARVEKLNEMKFDRNLGIEWGNQIRSYVLHPYKLVKDHRVDYEERDIDKVFNGDILGFLEALRDFDES